MGGFRRAQLRGSEELFRPTSDDEPVLELEETGRIAPTVTRPRPLAGREEETASIVPNLPSHDSRSLRLTAEEIEVIADALQYLKFPNKAPARPSVDEFERLEELRQKVLDQQ